MSGRNSTIDPSTSYRNRHVQLAYEGLGVKQEDVIQLPQITPHLKAMAAVIRRAGQPRVHKFIEGGGIINVETEHLPPYGPGSDIYTSWPWYLDASADPEARKLLDIYRTTLRSHRPHLPIEAFCLAAAVSPLRILEILTATCVRLGVQASTIVAAINHPRIVQKTVEMALTDGGTEDRATLHKATGFLPTPRGAQTNITIAANASAASTAQSASIAPAPENTIRRLANRFNERPALPADTGSIPCVEVMPHEELEAVLVDSEEDEE